MFMSYPFLPHNMQGQSPGAAAYAHISLLVEGQEAPVAVLRAEDRLPCDLGKFATNFAAFLNGRTPYFYLAPDHQMRAQGGEGANMDFRFFERSQPDKTVSGVHVDVMPGFEEAVGIARAQFTDEFDAFVGAIGKVERRSVQRLEDEQAALMNFFSGLAKRES